MQKSTLKRALVSTGVLALVLAANAQAQTTDVLVTSDSPLAAQARNILLSDFGADVFGVGAGQATLGTENFDLSAHTGPQRDFGHFGVKVTTPSGEPVVSYHLDVNCVHIHGPVFGQQGNRGVIRGVVDKVEPTPNVLNVTVGETIILGIKDGGEPSAGFVDDLFTPHADARPAINCKLLFYIGNVNNVDQGNILIKVN